MACVSHFGFKFYTKRSSEGELFVVVRDLTTDKKVRKIPAPLPEGVVCSTSTTVSLHGLQFRKKSDGNLYLMSRRSGEDDVLIGPCNPLAHIVHQQTGGGEGRTSARHLPAAAARLKKRADKVNKRAAKIIANSQRQAELLHRTLLRQAERSKRAHRSDRVPPESRRGAQPEQPATGGGGASSGPRTSASSTTRTAGGDQTAPSRVGGSVTTSSLSRGASVFQSATGVGNMFQSATGGGSVFQSFSGGAGRTFQSATGDCIFQSISGCGGNVFQSATGCGGNVVQSIAYIG